MRGILIAGVTALLLLTVPALAQVQDPSLPPPPTARPAPAPIADPAAVAAAPVPAAPALKPVPIKVTVNPIQVLMNKLYTAITGKTIDDVRPLETLVAPFAEGDIKPASLTDKNVFRLPTNAVPLDQPHRSAADLSEWLMQALAETLSFTSDSYNDHLKLMANGFNNDGIAQFNAWAAGGGILAALQKNGLQLNGFVSEKPFLLNEGNVGGHYRWLFEVPIIVSFVPRGTTSLSQVEGIDNRKLLVTLQVGRAADSILPDAVKIESWAVQDNTRKN